MDHDLTIEMERDLTIEILKYIERLKCTPPYVDREQVIGELRKILKETASVPIEPES